MDLPAKFPSEPEVIRADVTRFRALWSGERMRSLQGLLRTGARLRRMSPQADWARQYPDEQRSLAQRNIREFIARLER